MTDTQNVIAPEVAGALSLFAKLADQYDAAYHQRCQHFRDEGRKPGPDYSDSHQVRVSLGDCRRARAALHRLTTQSPLSQGGVGAEAVVTLREKMVKALDGHTKYSRDCDMSGEFLTNQVWPMVEATIRPAMPAPAQGVTEWSPVDDAPIGPRLLYAHFAGGEIAWAVSGYRESDGVHWHDGQDPKAFTVQPNHYCTFAALQAALQPARDSP